MEHTDNDATNDQASVDQEKAKTQEVDFKNEMEKAMEWAKKNPLPAGKSMFICWNNIIDHYSPEGLLHLNSCFIAIGQG